MLSKYLYLKLNTFRKCLKDIQEALFYSQSLIHVHVVLKNVLPKKYSAYNFLTDVENQS